MKIALISDIHGNAIALEIVLKEIKRSGVDQIVCLGDVATLGPEPNQVIDILKAINIDCIMGNHDEFMIFPDTVTSYTQVPFLVQSINLTRESLKKSDLEYIVSFQKNILLCDGRVRIHHGSPDSNVTNILPETDSDALDGLFKDLDSEIMIGGHTHIQMYRQHNGKLILNPGSVGIPFKKFVHGGFPEILSTAEYAILDLKSNNISVSLYQINMDKKMLREKAIQWDNPLAKPLSEFYV